MTDFKKWPNKIAQLAKNSFKTLVKPAQFSSIERLVLIGTAVALSLGFIDRERQLVNQSWQTIVTRASGNSGKVEALEYLNSHSCFRKYKERLDFKHCELFSLKKRIELVGIDLRTTNDQDGVYLRKINLNGGNLSGAQLVRAFMDEATLENISAERINLQLATLRKASLKRSLFAWGSLSRANLAGAKLDGASLWNANLDNANFFKTSLNETNLTGSYLYGAKYLTCDQLTAAKGWEASYRDTIHACGKEVPEPPKEKHRWVPKNVDSNSHFAQ